MRVIIGIVTYNSADDIGACLASIQRQTLPPHRVLIHDNASSDDTAARVRAALPTAELCHSADNIGYGRAHNALIERCNLAPDDVYLTLNPDVILAPTYCQRVVESMQQTGAAWGGGRLLWGRGRLYSAGHAIFRGGYAYNIAQGYPVRTETPAHPFGICGAAAAYTGRLIHDIRNPHFFDPRFFLYYEDVDIDWRANRRGWHCVVAHDALAYHRGGAFSTEKQRHSLHNRVLSTLKNASWPALLSVNVPLWTAHVAARLMLSPRFGVRMLRALLITGPHGRRGRLPSRASVAPHFRMAGELPGAAATRWQTRIRTYWQTRHPQGEQESG